MTYSEAVCSALKPRIAISLVRYMATGLLKGSLELTSNCRVPIRDGTKG